MNVKHRSMRPVVLAVMLAAGALLAPGVAAGEIVPPDCQIHASGTVSCLYFGSGSFVVPIGVTELLVEAQGEPGADGQTGQFEVLCAVGDGGRGGSGGDGSTVRATIPVSSGESFHVDVGTDLAGGSGGNGLSFQAVLCAEDADPYGGDGGAGGDGAGLANSSGYVLIAGGGGGGGGGASFDGTGGAGGGTGANGSNGQGPIEPGGAGGAAGNQSSGLGQGGGSGGGQLGAGGGGGGGGFNGGAGGSGSNGAGGGGGGGGGTNLVPSGGSVSTDSGRAKVQISYSLPNGPPTTAIEISHAPTGENGWYRALAGQGNPLVSVRGVDDDIIETRCALDPVAVSAFADLVPACPFLDAPHVIGTDGVHVVAAASKDAAGNVEDLKTLELKIDNTLPTISAAATTQRNVFGWYKTPVTVHYTCDDATSGVWVEQHPCPADHVFSDEGAQLTSPSHITVDRAGNTSDPSNVVTVNIDLTRPTITGGPTTQPNLAGWYRDDVVVGFDCHDNLSGFQPLNTTCDLNQTVSSEGSTNVAARTVSDLAGNESAPSAPFTIRIDKTPPTITGGATTQPNLAGWYRDDVVVVFDCHDDLSGVQTPNLMCLLTTVSNEGSTNFAARTVFDRAGNESTPSAPFTIRIDKTAPVVTTSAPITVSATSPAGAVVTYQSGANDNLDPSPVVVCTPASGSVFPIGTRTVTCEATDDAGNSATKQFTVKVLSAVEQLDLLRIAATGVGTGTSLADKVKQIQNALDGDRTRNACTGLNEFLAMVDNQAAKGKLTSAQAASLTTQANNLKGTLSC
jgi:hypothetical protein